MTKAPILVILAAATLCVGLLLSGCSSGSPPSQIRAVVTVLVEDFAGAPVAGAAVTITLGGRDFVGTEGPVGQYDVNVTMAPAGGVAQLTVTPAAGSGLVAQQGPLPIPDPRHPPAPTVVLVSPPPEEPEI